MIRSWFKFSVAVIIPTSVAAFNINRGTIHSTFFILIMNNKKLELDSIRLKQLQEKLQDMLYFIIDEKSIIGCRILELINMRLKEAFSKNNNKLFSG